MAVRGPYVVENLQNTGLQYGYDYFPSHQVRRRCSQLVNCHALDQGFYKTNSTDWLSGELP
jgi:hypothetical protein